MRVRVTLIVVMVMLLASAECVLAAESPWETIEWGKMNARERFKWALDLYQMGRETDAAEMMTRVISASPGPRAVADLQEMLSPSLRAAMLADARTTQAAQEWVKLYETSMVKLRRDDGYISEVVGGLTRDGAERERALKRLEQLGEFAVPHIIRSMDQTENTGHRVICCRALLRLGRTSTLPTIEYLESPDDSLRIALLQALGALKDVRAQAAVCKLAVDRQASAPVRKAAMDALLRILHQPRPGLALSRRPTVNYWRLADAYLHEREVALPTMEGDELPVWAWSDEKKWVTYRMVPRKLYNEEMAEEACYDGLSVDKDDMSLRSMAIAVYYAEKLELLGTDDAKVNRALELAILVGGKSALQRCMGKALADGDLGIAIQAAQTLGEVGAGQGFTLLEQLETVNPLLTALNHSDRAVRFAAARAVARCQPRGTALPEVPDTSVAGLGAEARRTGRFDNYWKVLPALSWGLMYELPSRTVLIIDPKTSVINYYKGELRRLGHDVMEATEVEAGAGLAAGAPAPEVVLLSWEFLPAIDGIRAMAASPHVPIVVLLPVERKDAAERVRRLAAGVLVGRATEKNIKLVLRKALEVPEKKLVDDLIPRISERAAVALAGIVPGASPLPMKSVVPALRRNLVSKDDKVRLGVLRALGNIAAGESSLDVLAVAADKRASKEIRLAALDALAKILKAQKRVPPDVFTDLVPISAEDDAEISLAAARAIAVAKFDPGQFADLMTLKRVQEIAAGRP